MIQAVLNKTSGIPPTKSVDASYSTYKHNVVTVHKSHRRSRWIVHTLPTSWWRSLARISLLKRFALSIKVKYEQSTDFVGGILPTLLDQLSRLSINDPPTSSVVFRAVRTKPTGAVKKLSAAIVVISLLAGTAAGQKKNERPPVSVPNEFRGAETTAATDQTSIGDLKWFEIFKDDELQKMVRTAMVQNYDLRLAVARINAARANLGLARSDQLPQFSAGRI